MPTNTRCPWKNPTKDFTLEFQSHDPSTYLTYTLFSLLCFQHIHFSIVLLGIDILCQKSVRCPHPNIKYKAYLASDLSIHNKKHLRHNCLDCGGNEDKDWRRGSRYDGVTGYGKPSRCPRRLTQGHRSMRNSARKCDIGTKNQRQARNGPADHSHRLLPFAMGRHQYMIHIQIPTMRLHGSLRCSCMRRLRRQRLRSAQTPTSWSP